jgi:hypothetical protein
LLAKEILKVSGDAAGSAAGVAVWAKALPDNMKDVTRAALAGMNFMKAPVLLNLDESF